jgi:dihydrofolate reductase
VGNLIYAMNVSLDGYISDRDGNFAWSVPTRELFSAWTEFERPIGTYLYGRRLYEAMAMWDGAHAEPGTTAFIPGLLELEREFAAIWRGAEKIVFSTTLAQPLTPRARIQRTFDPEQIRRLKATSERDITVGGPNLAAAMIAAGLVDELHAFIHPIVLGGGHPWLPAEHRIALELVGEHRHGAVVQLHYRRRV